MTNEEKIKNLELNCKILQDNLDRVVKERNALIDRVKFLSMPNDDILNMLSMNIELPSQMEYFQLFPSMGAGE